jgi:hypothetical protein
MLPFRLPMGNQQGDPEYQHDKWQPMNTQVQKTFRLSISDIQPKTDKYQTAVMAKSRIACAETPTVIFVNESILNDFSMSNSRFCRFSEKSSSRYSSIRLEVGFPKKCSNQAINTKSWLPVKENRE